MLVELDGVDKIFNRGEANEVQVLHKVRFSVATGEMVCLRGPSGSGKTTLLSIIGCVFPPSSGRASIAGRKVSRLPDHFLCDFRRQKIGFVFQHLNLLEDLSVIENIVLPLYPEGISPKKRYARATPLLEKMGLMHRKDFPVANLSGGEMQRVAICRALIHDPPLILADEPTAHLDSELTTELMTCLTELRNAGKTVIITSHDPRVYNHETISKIVDITDGRIIDG